MVCVSTYPSEVEAEMARLHLEANGVLSFISTDDCGSWEPWLQLCKGVRLMAAEEDASRALGLLKKLEEEAP